MKTAKLRVINTHKIAKLQKKRKQTNILLLYRLHTVLHRTCIAQYHRVQGGNTRGLASRGLLDLCPPSLLGCDATKPVTMRSYSSCFIMSLGLAVTRSGELIFCGDCLCLRGLCAAQPAAAAGHMSTLSIACR